MLQWGVITMNIDYPKKMAVQMHRMMHHGQVVKGDAHLFAF